ncbi:DNA (cytosine-5-)-methyltransferase [Acinetobacter sp. RIT592]|nr:DNA (cytosine-5-)-methyltransferase [Paraclostridium sp. AKS46]RDC51332.1 DNA (cytosine-5-)-methyltransferase [Acinetobacter sp. RIT592]
MRVCELFAGVGGFRLGLEDCSDDFRFVWANQWEPSKKVQHAYDCYIQRFGESDFHVNEDISTVDKRTIPNHDLLVGGFPCQDYSVARTGARGIQGVKGVLWWQIREILREKQPRFVLLENVDRLLKSPAKQRGRDFAVMLSCFNDLGYSVEWRVINAAEYGFVQRRRRIFIYAFRNDTNYFNRLDETNLERWIHEDGFFQDEFPILPIEEVDNSKVRQTRMEYNDIVEISDTFSFEFENAGIMTGGTIYTEKTVPNYNGEYILLRDRLETNVDEKYYIDFDESRLEKFRQSKAAKRINRVSKTGHEYVFSEGALAFPDPIDRPARTMLTSEASVNRSTHVVEDPATGRLRVLTPVEAERLNGFRDNWTNTGMTERTRYFCMGNALVVGLIRKMGNTLIDIYHDEEGNQALREAATDLEE